MQANGKSTIFAQNSMSMGKLLFYLDYILSVLPTELDDPRHPIHVIKKGSGKAHRGDTVAKIWIAEDGKKKIEAEWSELPPEDETNIRALISLNWSGLIAEIDLMKIRLNIIHDKFKDTKTEIRKLDFNRKRGMMAVFLTDGREVLVPVSLFPEIKELRMKQREDYIIMDGQFFSFAATTEIYSIADVLRA